MEEGEENIDFKIVDAKAKNRLNCQQRIITLKPTKYLI